MQPQVTVVMITATGVLRECLESVILQKADYPNLDLVVNYREPQFYSDDPLIQKYENCHRNRNEARERALKTAGEHFLFIDDDIVLPRRAVSTLVSQNREVV